MPMVDLVTLLSSMNRATTQKIGKETERGLKDIKSQWGINRAVPSDRLCGWLSLCRWGQAQVKAKACDWTVGKEGGLRVWETSTETERQRGRRRWGDKMESIREEEEPEPSSPRSHKYWGLLRWLNSKYGVFVPSKCAACVYSSWVLSSLCGCFVVENSLI